MEQTLTELLNMLKAAGPEVYQAYAAQMKVAFIIDTLWVFLSLTCIISAVSHATSKIRNDKYLDWLDDYAPIAVIWYMLTVVLLIVFFVSIEELLTMSLNPDYWVIKKLIGIAK